MNISIRFAVSLLTLIGVVSVSMPLSVFAGVSVWWPTDNATVSGSQPFKALVDEQTVDKYNMYWQVDGGQLNQMQTNTADYPHKEASVDLSGWNWNSTGKYTVRFVAKDNNGNTLADKSVVINIPGTAPAPVIATVSPEPVVVSAPQVTTTNTTNTDTTASAKQISVWWPVDGIQINGAQPFKARIDDMDVNSYSMYWQVDSGQLNKMDTNYSDAPHKETQVSVDGWNWKGAGSYNINFVAKNSKNATLAEKSVKITTGAITVSTPPSSSTNGTTPNTSTNSTTSTTSAPLPPTNVTVTTDASTLSGSNFYIDPNNPAKAQADAWRKSQPYNASLMDKIASQPSAKWLGNWNANIYGDAKSYVDAAANAGKVPVIIAYNIPGRDCGGYSAGNTSVEAYKNWIQNLANGIGNRKAVIILEPDSLALVSCLSSAELDSRYSLLNSAVTTLKKNPNAVVYLDGGHSNWNPASVMAERLNKAGVSKADGFALNVSNFVWTQDLVNYGKSISSMVGGKHFVIDTSRNGLGPNGSEWCNPSGRALGAKPTTNTGDKTVDAYLWLKTPGESDGNCNGGPGAGVWWSSYAVGLAERAAW